MGSKKTASARALIEPEVKKKAEKILKSLGLSISTSFELFYRQVIAQRGLPFELHVPNEKTMKAIENSRQDCRECHIEPDWLLIYRLEGSEFCLIRTGTHSDLFE
jgi:DNA-damage-inducible protein J